MDLTPAAIRRAFDATTAFTVGLEEEVLLVDPVAGLPIPVAADVVAQAGDPRIKTELPASQVELVTRAHRSVADAVGELCSARHALVQACGGWAAPIATAVHPMVAAGPVAQAERGRALQAEYGEVITRQLVSSLQVHVALGDADLTLDVYNALRGVLPELAALAAAAPFHEGRDTGLASVRPLIATQLPRQGVPPIIRSWEAFADDLRWGARSQGVPEPRRWWWELRPHVLHGTLEVRVADVQPTVAAAGAIAATVHALVCRLAERRADGERLGCPSSWRIAENRWQALKDGVHGHLADLETGEPMPTADRLHQLLDEVEAHAPGGLDAARALIERNSADELRACGLEEAVPWLRAAFAPDGRTQPLAL